MCFATLVKPKIHFKLTVISGKTLILFEMAAMPFACYGLIFVVLTLIFFNKFANCSIQQLTQKTSEHRKILKRIKQI